MGQVVVYNHAVEVSHPWVIELFQVNIPYVSIYQCVFHLENVCKNEPPSSACLLRAMLKACTKQKAFSCFSMYMFKGVASELWGVDGVVLHSLKTMNDWAVHGVELVMLTGLGRSESRRTHLFLSVFLTANAW